MKCNFEWISAYLDGALAEDNRAKLEEHLKTCETCTAKLEEFARVEQMAQKIPLPQLSEAYWENFASRVQNKLTIREKQKTSPAWLEALASFFQPTTGKLAMVGSVAVVLLLTFISLDQWKKQTFRPPVFEAETPKTEGKIDSVQMQAKDESEFRTAEKDKRLDQSARERGTDALSQKLAENRPAASAPVGRALVAPEEQKSKEETSLAAFAERDDTVKGDTVNGAAGKKAEETEKVPLQNRSSLQKRSLIASPTKDRIQSSEANDSISSSVEIEPNVSATSKDPTAKPTAPKKSVQEFGSLKGGFDAQYRGRAKPTTDTAKSVSDSQEWSLIRGADDTKYRGKAIPAFDTAQAVANIRQIIARTEKKLKDDLSKNETEWHYVNLARNYVQLYRFTLDQKDWEKANQHLTDFLKADLSKLARKRLLEIQAKLKKLKK